MPLAESRQMYHSMDLSLRKQFYGMMEKISNAHNLLQMTYPSFMLHQGFKTRYQCADYVYSMVATLETNVSLSNSLYVETFLTLSFLTSRVKIPPRSVFIIQWIHYPGKWCANKYIEKRFIKSKLIIINIKCR